MTTLKPERGLVIQYDFLWKEEAIKGRQYGSKDHPCAIVLTYNEQLDGSIQVIVCAISHTPPKAGQRAIEVPPAVARHLSLDDGRSWIKTHEVNVLTWEKDRVPVGVDKTPEGKWSYGVMPPSLYKTMRDNVIENSRDKSLKQVRRDESANTSYKG